MIFLSDCINFILTRAQNSVFTHFKNRLARFDVTPVQYAVLKCLWDNGDQSPTQISQSLYLDTSTITGILERMERKELIKRMHSKTDRRAITIRIKPLGKKLQPQIEQAIMGANHEVLAALSEEEFVKLKQLIARIVDSVDNIEYS
jgi:DNA-binding MarR family transcriptional regulator